MQSGFFAPSQLINRAPPSLIARCGECGLSKGCLSPKMPLSGEGAMKILLLGEAPGCVSGETLIEVAYRDKSKWPNGVPIKKLEGKSGFYVYSFDVNEQALVIGRVGRVWKTGRKKVYRVAYQWRDWEHNVIENSLVVTANHPFLIKRRIKHDPFGGNPTGAVYLSIDEGLQPGHALQPFYRGNYEYGFIGTSYKDHVKEPRFLLEFKLGRTLEDGEECHHKNEQKWDDRWDNLELMTTEDHARHHATTNNPMMDQSIREKHKRVMESSEYREKLRSAMKRVFENPEAYEKRLREIEGYKDKIADTVREKFRADPVYYYRYLLGRQRCSSMTNSRLEELFRGRFPGVPFPPEDNHRVVSVECMGEEDVYDMEVDEYHNFAAHGVFIHNSKEDKQNLQFVGKTGQYLERKLQKFMIDMRRDCWITNALICRPPKNRTPENPEIDFCRPNLLNALRELQPEIIIPLGNAAVRSLIGHLWRSDPGPVGQWVGWSIPDQQLNAWICPNWHPSYVVRANEQERPDPVPELFFERYLCAAVSHLGRPWPDGPPDYASQVELILEPERAASIIRKMIERGGPVAFDFETDRLKPDREDSRIVSCGVCWRGKKTIAFPWYGEAVVAMRELMKSALPKIAANMKFEERWCRRVLGSGVNNWLWDTMVAAHAIDNRSGITSVKFLSYALLGQPLYNDRIDAFLESDTSNNPNRIREVDIKDLLMYNGLDALLEYKICEIQRNAMGLALSGG